ncbi:MAG: polyprenyl synthetase family protein [Deltaproteobacteria bacterium]
MTLASTDSAIAVQKQPGPVALALVANELAAVEEKLRELTESEEQVLTDVAGDLIAAGGKRIRPALALLTFRAAGGEDPTDTIDVAAAIELIHSATLLHDDILDSGKVRRGRPSPLARFGAAATLVTGDFLFSKAFSVAGRFDAKVVGWAAEACVHLCEGEMLQDSYRRNGAVDLETYRNIARRKTASLFRQAARIGTYFAGRPEAEVEALAKFGDSIGLGFQMVDDLLDVVGPEELIGKPVGSDLREGSPALPTVLALDRLPRVREAFLAAAPDAALVESALATLRESSILGEVRQLAAAHIREALTALECLPESPYRDALEQVTMDLLERTN